MKVMKLFRALDSCFRQKKINIDGGATRTAWQKYKAYGSVLQRTEFCIFKAPVLGRVQIGVEKI